MNPLVEEVPYGDLMLMVDTNNRWVYKGSVTTPPCDTFVYWNVLRTVYPIKAHHFEQFKEQLHRGHLEVTGNNRVVQKIDAHDPHIVSESTGFSEQAAFIAILVILGLIFAVI